MYELYYTEIYNIMRYLMTGIHIFPVIYVWLHIAKRIIYSEKITHENAFALTGLFYLLPGFGYVTSSTVIIDIVCLLDIITGIAALLQSKKVYHKIWSILLILIPLIIVLKK